jgi:hypothetical protein
MMAPPSSRFHVMEALTNGGFKLLIALLLALPVNAWMLGKQTQRMAPLSSYGHVMVALTNNGLCIPTAELLAWQESV